MTKKTIDIKGCAPCPNPGDWYVRADCDNKLQLWLLARVDTHAYVLCNAKTGHRYHDPVDSPDKVFADRRCEFTKVRDIALSAEI